MMAGLMYKNFLLYRAELAVIGVLQLFISAMVFLTGITGTGSPQGTLILYGCMFLMLGFVESGLFAPDEKQTARNFLIATPTGAAGHIGSKYWFLLLIDLGVLVCCFLTDTVVFALTGDENTMTGVMLVLVFSVTLIMDALSLPFSGAGAGAMTAIGICTCCGMLAATFVGIVFVPALYAIFQRLRDFVKREKGR